LLGASRRENRFPIVFHADDDPAFRLRLSHERIAERANLRLGAVGVLTLGVIVMDKHHQSRTIARTPCIPAFAGRRWSCRTPLAADNR
jgi:hypothetical protein